jgi:hypothetical protein
LADDKDAADRVCKPGADATVAAQLLALARYAKLTTTGSDVYLIAEDTPGRFACTPNWSVQTSFAALDKRFALLKLQSDAIAPGGPG